MCPLCGERVALIMAVWRWREGEGEGEPERECRYAICQECFDRISGKPKQRTPDLELYRPPVKQRLRADPFYKD